MRTETVTDSATLNPSGYDNVSTYSTNSISSGYTASSSTNYSTIYLKRGNEAETVFYYKFASPEIPSNATINSITCSVKVYNNTSTSYVATKTIQLCTGTTTKGSASNISASTTAFDITCGSWTASETNDLRLKLYAQRTSSNYNTSYYIRFYGATLTINYTYEQAYYTVSVSSTANNAIASPLGDTEYEAGEQTILTLNGDINKFRVIDNGVIVNNALVIGSGTQTSTATSVSTPNDLSNSAAASSVIGRGYDTTLDNASEIYCSTEGNSTNFSYSFDFSSVPSGFEVSDFYVRVLAKAASGGTEQNSAFDAWLYYGNGTSISQTYSFSTSKSVTTLYPRSDVGKGVALMGLKIAFNVGYYGGYIYGMTAYVIGAAGNYKKLTINLSSDHVITVEDFNLFLKKMGDWESVAKVWRKTNGTWSLDYAYIFSPTIKYINGTELVYDSEIAYLESTGTQYIDLPLSVPAGTYMDVEFTAIALLNSTDYGYGIFGVDVQNQFSSRFYSYNSETNMSLMSTNVGEMSTNGGYNLKVGIPSTIKVSTTGKTHYDGTFSSLERPTTAAISSFRLFGVYETTSKHPIRICMFKIRVGENLVYDLIPVRIGDKGYLYDKISHVLFGNVGTGDFVLGGDKPYVTYLESTGTQYIDTGIVPTADTGIMVKVTNLDNSDTYLVGQRNNSGNTRWCIGHDNNNKYYYGYGTWATGGSSYPSESTIARLDYNNDGKFAISEFDGTSQMSVSLPTLSFSPTNAIRLFGGARESGGNTWSGRMYYAQITQDNVLVRDFVPTSVNGVGYMYDKVTKQLYGNSGTGNFIIGTDRVEKPYDAEVEYIKSSGTEYIDTGYIPTVNTHIIMRAAYKGSGYTDNMNGEMESSTNKRFHWGVGGSGSFQKYHFACGSSYTNTTEDVDEYAHVFELWGNGKFKIDGRSNTIGTNESDTADDLKTTTKSITLFARNDASSVGKFINDMELYSFQIYESDALMMDFIPVRIGVTSYLYDKIGNQLYGNSGTGYFAHGDDII